MRRRFLRRVVLVVALFFGLTVLANVLAVVLLTNVFGLDAQQRLAPFVAILGVSLLVAFLATGWSVRRMARPVGEVMEAAERVSGGNYDARVEERGPREIRRLVRSFNAMTEQLRSAEEQRRNLLADLAHELRTPLSVIRGQVEGVLDGLYPADRSHLAPVVEEAAVMSRLLDDLQTLSTAEAGALRLRKERMDPGDVVADAVAAFGARARSAGVTLKQRVAENLTGVEVDPVRIGEVLANLLMNAVRHTPSGGAVVVAAQPAGDERVAFSVEDSGLGIDPQVLPQVFDRFVKSGDSRGAGLGLAIAKSLVEAHGGTIVAESSPGAGATVTFTLPAGELNPA
jgi:signal transduction histidine kinase